MMALPELPPTNLQVVHHQPQLIKPYIFLLAETQISPNCSVVNILFPNDLLPIRSFFPTLLIYEKKIL